MNTINFYTKISIKEFLVNSLLLIFIFFLPLQNSFASDKLSTLQTEIKKSKISQVNQSKKQQALENSVANSEQEIATAALQLEETQQAIVAEKIRLKTLKKQTLTLNEDKTKQQELLKQQLISAYMTGQNDLVKLLLNQEDISQIIRSKSYYFYINKARLESIEALANTQQELEKNQKDQVDSLAALENMRNKQIKNKNILSKQRKQRSKALKELNQDLNYQQARLAQLNHAEKSLKEKMKKQQEARKKEELAQARKAAQENSTVVMPDNQTHSSITEQKGKLNWPIRGKVLASFGSQRSSQVKWKGIAIAANEGEKVRAVATGRVLFAGYFKGYGMVIALDHSDNYITLYGYNQTLLQKTGDIVFQGDAIALAGHSGGQDKNSLYFELSHKGKAQNPIRWLKKRK